VPEFCAPSHFEIPSGASAKYFTTASENLSTPIGNIGLILTYMYTENLVKFGCVISEICEQFAMFVFSNSGLNTYYLKC